MEKFEKLDNEQKELVKYWIEKLAQEAKSIIVTIETRSFTEKHLTPEPVIEVGKWYKRIVEGSSILFFCTKITGSIYYGYGFGYKGIWCEDNTHFLSECDLEEYRQAATEEYEPKLIKLAKSKGYKADQKIFSARTGEVNTIKNGYKSEFTISSDGSHFYYMDACVMSNGKWAEIIDEKAELREAIEMLSDQILIVKQKMGL